MLLSYLQIKNTTTKGRGVFTNQDIETDTIVEVAPVIVLGKNDRENIDKTLLHDYIFQWGHNTNLCCMALGYVPIYNHAYKSNCEYIMDYDTDSIIIKTITNISEGEELTINYNGDTEDQSPIWFHKNVQ